MKLVALHRTCGACPEQYEGETDDGQFVYLRHRHGAGRLSVGPTFDDAVDGTWSYQGPVRGRDLLVWQDEDWDGQLRPGALAHILYLAGLEPTAEVAQVIKTSPDADDFIEAAAELGIHLTTAFTAKDAE